MIDTTLNKGEMKMGQTLAIKQTSGSNYWREKAMALVTRFKVLRQERDDLLQLNRSLKAQLREARGE